MNCSLICDAKECHIFDKVTPKVRRSLHFCRLIVKMQRQKRKNEKKKFNSFTEMQCASIAIDGCVMGYLLFKIRYNEL